MDLNKYIDGKELFDGHYRLIKLLSEEGGTADVWLAENYESVDTTFSEENDDIIRVEGTGVLVAIKIYRPKNALDVEGEQSFRQEFKTIFNCHHANLIPTTDYSICDGMPYLVMPFCKNGSAEKLVGKLTSPDDIWKFIFDTASGLEYLHACTPQIIHQDIKPGNILIDSLNNYCIADFGISIKNDVADNLYLDNKSSGTICYMPPERFADNSPITEKSDIWALGASLYELITGELAYTEGGKTQLKKSGYKHIDRSIPKAIRKIIESCLEINPEKRPTAHDICLTARRYVESPFWGNRNVLLGLVISILIACVLLFYFFINNSSKEIPKREFLEIFEGTWVCDHPEVPIWEEWKIPMSGILLYSYNYSHIKEKQVTNVKAVPIFEDSILTIRPDTMIAVSGKITNYDLYEFTWKTEMGPFTYNRVVKNISLQAGDIFTPEYRNIINTVKIDHFSSHNQKIAIVHNKTGKIKALKEGVVYIECVTKQGAALIKITIKRQIKC